jgi:hypothetical protein
MNESSTQDLKKIELKLKTQQKQLQVVQALIKRSSGYTKAQGEASEKRLEKEIKQLQTEVKALTKK